jgi:hypothetical protein
MCLNRRPSGLVRLLGVTVDRGLRWPSQTHKQTHCQKAPPERDRLGKSGRGLARTIVSGTRTPCETRSAPRGRSLSILGLRKPGYRHGGHLVRNVRSLRAAEARDSDRRARSRARPLRPSARPPAPLLVRHTAPIVSSRDSFIGEQRWEGSTTASGRRNRPPPLL